MPDELKQIDNLNTFERKLKTGLKEISNFQFEKEAILEHSMNHFPLWKPRIIREQCMAFSILGKYNTWLCSKTVET